MIGKCTFPVKITDVKSDASMSNQLHHIDMFTLLHDMNYAQIILDSWSQTGHKPWCREGKSDERSTPVTGLSSLYYCASRMQHGRLCGPSITIYNKEYCYYIPILPVNTTHWNGDKIKLPSKLNLECFSSSSFIQQENERILNPENQPNQNKKSSEQ